MTEIQSKCQARENKKEMERGRQMTQGECPRCEGKEIQVIGKSPTKGVWEFYQCRMCRYIWRSTETRALLTRMKLTEKEIREIPSVPEIGGQRNN